MRYVTLTVTKHRIHHALGRKISVEFGNGEIRLNRFKMAAI